MSLNKPASLFKTVIMKWRVTWWKQSPQTTHITQVPSWTETVLPAFQWQHRWRTAWLSGVQHKGAPGWDLKRQVWDAVNNSIALWYKSCAYTTALAVLLAVTSQDPVVTSHSVTTLIHNIADSLRLSTDCHSLTWKDLMKVHSKVRMPSPLLSSLTNRITLNRRKKVIEMRALSSVFWSGTCGERLDDEKRGGDFQADSDKALYYTFIHAVSHPCIQ